MAKSTKTCPICGGVPSELSSTDTKMCHDCGHEYPWPLTAGQVRVNGPLNDDPPPKKTPR